MIAIRSYQLVELLMSNTVESFLLEVGYSKSVVDTLKRPFREVIYLPDGRLIRKRIRLNEWAHGFLYVLLRNGDALSEKTNLKTMFKLGLLTGKVCLIQIPEVQNGT